MKKNTKALAVFAAFFIVTVSGCASMTAGWALDEAKAQAKNGNYALSVAKTLEAIKGSEGKNADAVAYLPVVVAEGDAYYNGILAKEADPYAQFNALAGLVDLNEAIKKSGTTAVAAKDYSVKFSAAQKAAGEFAFGNGKKALAGGKIADGRNAYAAFSDVELIYKGSASPFGDLAALKTAAYELGLVRVFVVIPDDKRFGDLVSGGTPELVSVVFAGKLKIPGDAAWVKIESGLDALMKYKAWTDGEGAKYVSGQTAAGLPLVGTSEGKKAFAASVKADALIYGLVGAVTVSFSDLEKDAKYAATVANGQGQKYEINVNSNKILCTVLSDPEFYTICGNGVLQSGGSGGGAGTYWSASYTITDPNVMAERMMELTQESGYERQGALYSYPHNGYGILVGGPSVNAAEAAAQLRILKDDLDQWKAQFPADRYLVRLAGLAISCNDEISRFLEKK